MSLTIRKTMLIGLMSVGVSLPAFADHNREYQDQARVLSVTPQIERVNSPVQECRTEYIRERAYEDRRRSNTGAVIGGVTGGLLGSTIGRGNGKVVAAVLGAGVGAIVGDRVDNNRRYDDIRNDRVVTRPVESCVMVDRWSSETTGYLVNYEYNGRQYSTVTQQDPGRFIPVNVAVRPSGYVSEVNYEPTVNRHDDYRSRRSDKRQYW